MGDLLFNNYIRSSQMKNAKTLISCGWYIYYIDKYFHDDAERFPFP